MSKFEEYDLYAGNKDFLVSENVLTFTDTDGKLLALKPDVTLSIVKNFHAEEKIEKVYYHENVYRASGQGFREIEQAGLECLGDVDEYSVCEVLALAAQTLLTIGDRVELDISHLGLLCETLVPLVKPARKAAMELIGGKNYGELETLLDSQNISTEICERILSLASLDCPVSEASQKLREILGGYVSWERLQLFCDTCEFLGEEFPGTVRVDFSAVGDMNYYSGIIFRGYTDGVPQCVLTGGQYDGLMERLGKNGRAIGFALYLDMLEQALPSREYDFDALLSYSEADSPHDVYRALKTLKQQGLSVMASNGVPSGLDFKETYYVSAGGTVKNG